MVAINNKINTAGVTHFSLWIKWWKNIRNKDTKKWAVGSSSKITALRHWNTDCFPVAEIIKYWNQMSSWWEWKNLGTVRVLDSISRNRWHCLYFETVMSFVTFLSSFSGDKGDEREGVKWVVVAKVTYRNSLVFCFGVQCIKSVVNKRRKNTCHDGSNSRPKICLDIMFSGQKHHNDCMNYQI